MDSRELLFSKKQKLLQFGPRKPGQEFNEHKGLHPLPPQKIQMVDRTTGIFDHILDGIPKHVFFFRIWIVQCFVGHPKLVLDIKKNIYALDLKLTYWGFLYQKRGCAWGSCTKPHAFGLHINILVWRWTCSTFFAKSGGHHKSFKHWIWS